VKENVMAVSMDSIVKLPTAKKVLILLAVVVVILGVYGYLVYLPQQAKLMALRLEFGKLNKELEESKAIARDLAKFKQEAENLQKDLTLALAQLPNKKEIPSLLRNISSLGKGSGLEFLLFKPKPEERVGAEIQSSKPKPAPRGRGKTTTPSQSEPQEPQEFYARVPLELTILGSYHNVATFFDKVSKLDRIINILNFSMGDVKEIGGETILKTSCLATTFRFLETKEGGSAENTRTESQR
jgi:type IV pilus assembly protein PilO